MEKNHQKESIAMNNLTVRPAERGDLSRILDIYAIARKFMADNGNPTQWPSTYPPREQLLEDMDFGHLFAVTDGREIRGVFAFILGPDRTYTIIENGFWRSDTPYGTIHRIASDGTGGILKTALEFAGTHSSHLRIDTHADNRPMQHLLEKYGFSRRGIIYTDNGSPRFAYDRLED